MIVSIVCPCRNEVSHVDGFLRDVTKQHACDFDLEILIADGQSDDGTAEVLAAWCARDPRIKVLSNSDRIASTGLNAAVRAARGEIIVRMDVHTQYSDDYVAQCVRSLRQSGATCVGGPWLPKGTSLRQRSIAAAFSSPFGSGGAKSRRPNYTGPIDTVYLGAWRRADLIELGGFDENLVRNQDDELCLRITRSGGVVWQSAEIRSYYLPRDTLAGLWEQFYQYGYWKVAVIKKHRLPAAIRQLAPPLFIAVLLTLTVIGLVSPAAMLIEFALLMAYLVAAASAAITARASYQPTSLVLVILSLMCMHFSYGLGFGHGLMNFIVLRDRNATRMCALNR
jgi:succinoglycan biosynthesis protein ExoA